jgi:hypothetical protein
MSDQLESARPALSDRELLIRIDTRLEGVIEEKKDHENRIRKNEEDIRTIDDKANRAVTPKQLWAGLAGAVGVAAGAVSIIGPLVKP